jgi:hypothetical protein
MARGSLNSTEVSTTYVFRGAEGFVRGRGTAFFRVDAGASAVDRRRAEGRLAEVELG